jgi:hypothetical protein
MKVYLAYVEIADSLYDGPVVLKIFSNKESAEKYADNYFEMNSDCVSYHVVEAKVFD